MRILLFPFQLFWQLLTIILKLTGRLIGVALSVVVMAIGIVFLITVIGGVIGIPLIILGFCMLIRSIF